MVNFTDLKFYDSEDSLGGPIDTRVIQTGTPNNLFVSFTRDQVISGSTKYKCFYMKNESSEDMENFKIWLSSGTPLDYTGIWFGFDNLVNPFDFAMGFDGVNDYLDCGNHADLWSRTLTKFSFGMWIYINDAADGFFRTVIKHGSGNNSFDVFLDDSLPTTIVFRITDNSGNEHMAACEIQKQEWQHVICSFDQTQGSNNVRIYVSAEINTAWESDNDFTGSINLSADLRIADATNDFYGYIRDFKFWHDQSINENEAEELYEDGEISDSTESYHLTFGERSGTTTKDQVSKTKTATMSGAFWKNNAQTIADVFTAPKIRNNHWYEGGDIPSGTFKLRAGLTLPIWCKVAVEADPTAQEYLNDNGIFTIRFDVTATGTGSSGTPGTGGGTGASPPTTSTNYKIAVAGDWGNTGDTSDVIELMDDQDYDLILGVGDNAYDDSSASSWCNKFNRFKDRFESAWGNHEYEEDDGTGPYKNFFGYSRSYHSHRFQNCLILILDSNDDKSGVDLNEQRTWAKNELEKYKNDARVVWRIVVMHHPWFGDGSKHEENEFDQVQKFHKLFTDYDVNFVYAGHNHHWLRSHQVSYNSGEPTEPNVVDSSSPYTRTGNGLIYIVSGTGGHDGPGDFYSLPDDDDFWAYRNKSHNGVHELVASNGGNTLTGKFRNTDNNTFDTFTITA